ncbi:MAG: hypothetical protein ACRD4D_10515, partial [Candidatus Acidiferrales bacterium]
MGDNGHNSIVIGMSGGVDSSAAAALLAQSRPGNVVGLTMQLWDQRRLQNPKPVMLSRFAPLRIALSAAKGLTVNSAKHLSEATGDPAAEILRPPLRAQNDNTHLPVVHGGRCCSID